MNQRDVFLSSEGDNWFIRNRKIGFAKSPEIKFLLNYLKPQPIQKLLEIGCSSGGKTKILARKLHAEGYGIDPSKLAIKKARSSNHRALRNFFGLQQLNFNVGTAEKLMFGTKFFDFIYFGFCLYLVDRNLINDSLSEANRCLKPGGFIAIKDFDYGSTHVNKYKHKKGMKSFKEDYTDYFIKLGYKLVSKESYVSQKIGFQIDPDERISIWLLHKPK
jgi:ubiquinone/menaquinone biosynthesis C-methylase UbiE